MKNLNDLCHFSILNEQVPGRKGQKPSPPNDRSTVPGTYIPMDGVPEISTDTYKPLWPDRAASPSLSTRPSSSPESTDTTETYGIEGINPTMKNAMSKSQQKKDRELLARFKRVAERQSAEGTPDENLKLKIQELEGKIGNPYDPSIPDQLNDYNLRQNQINYAYAAEAEGKMQAAEATKKKLKDMEGRGLGKFVGGGRQLFTSGPSFKTAEEEDAYNKAKEAFDYMKTTGERERSPEEQKTMEGLFDTSREASGKVDRQRKFQKRISGMYDVTHGDFFSAFGHEYDALNKQDQRLFFDLQSRLKNGEKINPYDKPDSSYDQFSGTIVRKPSNMAGQKTAKNEKDKEDQILRQAQRDAGEWFERETDAAREEGAPYANGEQRQQRSASFDPISAGINSGIANVGKKGKDIGQKILDMTKVQLMEPRIPMGMGRNPADSDFQRGQFNINDPDLGPEPEYSEPFGAPAPAPELAPAPKPAPAPELSPIPDLYFDKQYTERFGPPAPDPTFSEMEVDYVEDIAKKKQQQRQNLINELERDLGRSGGRTIDVTQIPPSTPGKDRHIGDTDQQRGQFNINDPDLGPEPEYSEPFGPPAPKRRQRSASFDPISAGINSGIKNVVEKGKNVGQKILDMTKVQLMEPRIPMEMGKNLADSDFQRGQFNINDPDLGPEPEYSEPFGPPERFSIPNQPKPGINQSMFNTGWRNRFGYDTPPDAYLNWPTVAPFFKGGNSTITADQLQSRPGMLNPGYETKTGRIERIEPAPAPKRKPIVRGLGIPTNQGINALVGSAKNAAQKLNDYLKLNLAQTMPTTMATKLYGSPETAVVPFSNVQRGQFPIDMYYDQEKVTGINDPNIVDRIVLPTYNTKTGQFINEPRKAFQRNSNLPLNIQQFLDRIYRMSR